MDKKHSFAFAALLALTAGSVAAHEARYATVRVLAVQPLYETVVVESPVTACHREYVDRRVAQGSVAGPTLAGAIIGAAIGRQFGDGSGRDALTVIGAVAGSAVANDRALKRSGRVAPLAVVREPVERCTTQYRRHAERRLTGYWVDYRHRGRQYRILTTEHPGERMRIAVRS
jgi:uncharacterized protein YcfJ